MIANKNKPTESGRASWFVNTWFHLGGGQKKLAELNVCSVKKAAALTIYTEEYEIPVTTHVNWLTIVDAVAFREEPIEDRVDVEGARHICDNDAAPPSTLEEPNSLTSATPCNEQAEIQPKYPLCTTPHNVEQVTELSLPPLPHVLVDPPPYPILQPLSTNHG